LKNPQYKKKCYIPLPPNGEEKTWKWGHETAINNLFDFTVRRDQQNELGVYMKSRLDTEGLLPTTFWDKSRYSTSDYGTNLF